MNSLRVLARRWVSLPVGDAASYVEEAFCQRLYLLSNLSLWAQSLMDDSRDTCVELAERETAWREIVGWICQRQDATGVGGPGGVVCARGRSDPRLRGLRRERSANKAWRVSAHAHKQLSGGTSGPVGA